MKFLQNRFTGLAALIGVLIFLAACQRHEPVEMLQGRTNDFLVRQSPVSFSSGDAIEGQYIVVFKETADVNNQFRMLDKAAGFESFQLAAKQASHMVMERNKVPVSVMKSAFGSPNLTGMVARLDRDQLAKLKKDEAVAYIEQDQMFALSVEPFIRPPLSPTSGSTNTTQVSSWGVSRVGGTGSVSWKRRAWIIDTGIDLDHPDLNVDGNRSANFCTQGTFSSSGNDGHGHGTHVAGIIGAKDNGFGALGVVPGVKVVSVKVLSDEGYGQVSDVIAGAIYVLLNADDDDVVNVSLGGVTSQTLDNAVGNIAAYLGTPVVVAAGNNSQSVSSISPARLSLPNVYIVSSIGQNDQFSVFSNYGSTVDFAAPGEAIFSTYKDGLYATMTGTSMAAPHAAGVLLLTGNNPHSNGSALNPPDANAYPIVNKY
jgi:hypothetical protein